VIRFGEGQSRLGREHERICLRLDAAGSKRSRRVARALMTGALARIPSDTHVDRRKEMTAWLAKLPAR